jgi:ribosomal protein L12E/L44/L45/RPP1/RPP2
MAWMRELGGIQPSEDTLALALVLWEEVSVEAPLVEVMARYTSSASTKKRHDGIAEEEMEREEEGQEEEEEEREERRPPANEYERFVVWMEDWVGRRRMPDQEALMKWRGIVKAMREARPRSRGHHNGDGDTDESE